MVLAIPLAVALIIMLPLLLLAAREPATQATPNVSFDLGHGLKVTWQQFTGLMAAALSGITSWLQNAVWPLVAGLWAWQNSHQQLLAGLGVHIESSQRVIGRITGSYIPAARQHADQVGAQVYHDSTDYAQQGDRAVTAHADAGIAQAEAYAHDLSQSDRQLMGELNAQTQAYAASVGAAAEAYAVTLSQQDQQLALQLQAQAVAYAQQLAAQGIAYGQLVQQEVTAFVQGQVAELERYVETVQRADTAYTQQAVGQAVGPLALAQAATAAAVSELENSDCIKFCNPLGSLGAALEAIDLAALLALMAEIARDPKGGTALVEELIGPILGEIEAEARRLLGVKAA